MFVEVNGAKLFFDVEGAGLVPDGPRMRAKPTLILLHGGSGSDHSSYKPAFSALADEDIVAALPPHLVRFERFPHWGHSVITDAPARAFAVTRDFISL